MCSEQSFDNHDSFYVPSLAMVQLTWDTTAKREEKQLKMETVATLPGDLGLIPIAEALKSTTSRTGGKPNVIARGPEPCSPGISRARSRIGPGSLATVSKNGHVLACEARTTNPKTRTEGRRPELTTNQSRKATRAQGEGLSFLTKAHPTEVEGMTSLVPGLSVTRNVSAACFHMPVPVAPSARYFSCFRAACRINPRSIFRQSPVLYCQRPDTGLKAPPALGGSAMVVRLTGRQIFAVNGTAPARHDRRAEPGHSTSEMIQEDMKIL